MRLAPYLLFLADARVAHVFVEPFLLVPTKADRDGVNPGALGPSLEALGASYPRV